MANLLDLEELQRLQRLYPDWELMSEKDQNRLLAAQRRKKTGDFFSGLWGGDDDVNISQQPSTPVGAEEEVGLLQRPLSLDDMDTRIITRGLLEGGDTPRPSWDTNPLESGRALAAETLGAIGDIGIKPLWNQLLAPAGGGVRSLWTGDYENYRPLKQIEGEPFLGKHYWRTAFGEDVPEGMDIKMDTLSQKFLGTKKEGEEVTFDISRYTEPVVTPSPSKETPSTVTPPTAPSVTTSNETYAELGLGPDEDARMKEIDKNYWMGRMMLRAGNASSAPSERYLTKSVQQLGLELDKYDRAIRLATLPKTTWYWYNTGDNVAPKNLAQGVDPGRGWQQSQPRVENRDEADRSALDAVWGQVGTKYTKEQAVDIMMEMYVRNNTQLSAAANQPGKMGEPAWEAAANYIGVVYMPGRLIPYTKLEKDQFRAAWEAGEWERIQAWIDRKRGWPEEYDEKVKARRTSGAWK
mgnify:CR=1 FL=1